MHPNKQKETAVTSRSLLKQHALGAAHAVTGSLFLYEYFYDGKVTRWLLDAGLTVEDPKADFRKRLPDGITAADIDFIIISHAHADHCGYLPKLIKDGFKGKVFVTPATKDLMSIILPDSGHLQEEAAKRMNRRFRRRQGEPVRSFKGNQNGSYKGFGNGRREIRTDRNGRNGRNDRNQNRFTALYNEADAREAMKSLVTVDYRIRRRVSPENRLHLYRCRSHSRLGGCEHGNRQRQQQAYSLFHRQRRSP